MPRKTTEQKLEDLVLDIEELEQKKTRLERAIQEKKQLRQEILDRLNQIDYRSDPEPGKHLQDILNERHFSGADDHKRKRDGDEIDPNRNETKS